jgi:hypothetical protein
MNASACRRDHHTDVPLGFFRRSRRVLQESGGAALLARSRQIRDNNEQMEMWHRPL